MRRGGLASAHAGFVALWLSAAAAGAEPLPQPAGQFAWRGFYFGANVGGALSFTDMADPFGASIFGDTLRTPGPLAGGQAGYNWQLGPAILGFEADADWADLDGTNTCFATSGFYLSDNCRAHVTALGTLTGRFGWTLGPDSATLLYAKAGAAWRHSEVEASTNGGYGFPNSSVSGFQLGWTLGAGAERAMSAHWSLKAEYDYLSFASTDFATTQSGFQSVPSPNFSDLAQVAPTATSFSQDAHLLKVGLNYRLGEAQYAPAADAGALPAQPIAGTELEIGARYVYGWGRFQKDLGIQDEGYSSLASRLTYGGMHTNGAELFARLDTPANVMVKGFVGKGQGDGQLNDEDWGIPFAIFIPYSNTLSDVGDHIRYGVIDVGYDVWRDQRFRAAPFVGYSIFHQYMQAFGCVQIANPNSDCVPSIPTTIFALSEDDIWKAVRLGAAVDILIAPGLRLSADAAYLPYVQITGIDDHILRSLISPENGHGTGTQLEAILSYTLTDRFRVGVGARYWSMWTSSGGTNFGGSGDLVPMRFAAEQAALLVQGSYTFEELSGAGEN